MSALKKLYLRILTKHLFVVQSLQTGVMMASGDLIAQTFIERRSIKQLNYWRTGRFFILGTCLVGPSLSKWYLFLSRTIGHTGDSVTVMKKVALDQLLFAPTFLAIFFVAINTLERHSWVVTKEQLNLKYKDVLLANYKLWPAVQLVNFYVIPFRHQVLFVQGIALIWNAYLSWKVQHGLDKNGE